MESGKPTGTGGGPHGTAAPNYASATIVAPASCCAAVQAVANQPFLATRAPLLPLRDCTMPGQCQCRYQKATDRRDEDAGRRGDANSLQAAWFRDRERRHLPGRRRGD
jgi:hypothetical protein